MDRAYGKAIKILIFEIRSTDLNEFYVTDAYGSLSKIPVDVIFTWSRMA